MDIDEAIALLEDGTLFDGRSNDRDHRRLRDAVVRCVQKTKAWETLLGPDVLDRFIASVRDVRRSISFEEDSSLTGRDRDVANALSRRMEMWDEFEPVSSGRVFDRVKFPSLSDRDALMRGAVEQGIETWARRALFDDAASRTVVCEFRRRSRGGWATFIKLDSVEKLALDARHVATTRAAHAVLVPSQNNLLQVRHDGGEFLRVTWNLGSDAFGDLRVLSEADDGPLDMDVYCEPKGADDGMTTVLQALSDLVAAPWYVARGAADPTPEQRIAVKTGVGPVTNQASTYAGPYDLLTGIAPPFCARFFRVPLREMLEQNATRIARGEEPLVDSNATQVEFLVDVGSSARAVAALLDGRLKLNHVMMWNRFRTFFDRNDLRGARNGLRLDSAGVGKVGRPVVTRCKDLRGTNYVDVRWGSHLDPSHRFQSKVSGSGAARLLHLEFLDPALAYRDLYEVGVLLSIEWPDDHLADKRLTPRLSGALQGCEVFVHADSAADATEPRDVVHEWGLLPALSSGRGTFPGGQAMSRLDLKRLVLAVLPGRLLRAVPAGTVPGDLEIATVLRRPQHDPRSWALRKVLPVTVVTVPLARDGEVDAARIDDDLAWVSRTVEDRCIAGVRIEVELSAPAEATG